jgi:beta-lactamase regulating signal transducer with metallopeptidase domain
MANWSQSHFLQSLGWATINSFWQMALLWCFYLLASYLFQLSSAKKYQFAVAAILAGFAWFVFSFFHYFQSSPVSALAFFNQTINESNSLLNIFLYAASVAYLSLLIFPSYKLFKNWQFVQRIKKHGLQKADLSCRLFVQKISIQLGITKKVLVYISHLVKSPVTIGYLKPIILLPLAAFNNLSAQQVEAVLLHELSHIRRYDYLVNLVISVISTLLYFNPFVKKFMRTIEEERENCCDQLVLQFGYDKVGYASALLTLEKISVQQHALILCATGKNYLLSRIEKIIGMPAGQSDREKKKENKLNHFAALFAALFCIVIFNSVLIIKEKKNVDPGLAYDGLSNPFAFFNEGQASQSHSIVPDNNTAKKETWTASLNNSNTKPASPQITQVATIKNYLVEENSKNDMFMNVAQDDIDAILTNEQKEEIKTTVDATKKIFSNLQWKEIDNSIGDVMTENEKLKAKEAYMKAIEHSKNFKNIEQNMKANYESLNWNKINSNVEKGLTIITLDSIQNVYSSIIVQLDKVSAEACSKAKVAVNPLPDQSLNEIQRSTEILRMRVDSIKAIRSPKKIVRL